MQTEQQNQLAVLPETLPQGESTKSKHGHGGKRPGVGRKPNPTKLLKGVSRETLAAAVANIDIAAVVVGLLRSKKEVICLQTLNFVYNRMLGKPKQDLSVSGGLVHAHTRDPFLASLPKEVLEQLARSYDEVLAKYIPEAAQNGPQNQADKRVAASSRAYFLSSVIGISQAGVRRKGPSV